MDMETLLSGYTLFCQAEGKSERTTEWYIGKLTTFQKYLKSEFGVQAAREVETHMLRAFVVYLRTEVYADELNPRNGTRVGERLSPHTIHGYVRALKAFFGWAKREGLIPTNPAALVRLPKAPKKIVATLSPEQITKLLAAIDTSKPVGFRDYCMALTLLDTGVRLSELTNLLLSDVDLEQSQFRVFGKGAKERIVPMGASLQKMLWKYIHRFRPEPANPHAQTLFLTQDGRTFSTGGIYDRFKMYGKRAGLEGVRCSPHTFRHTFAKTFLMNGGDLFTLQKILGHSSLDVVRLYVNLSSKDVQDQHRRYSPVDLMGIRVRRGRR